VGRGEERGNESASVLCGGRGGGGERRRATERVDQLVGLGLERFLTLFKGFPFSSLIQFQN
jgi:hypothetical protein